MAKQSPESFMLSEPEIITLDADGRSRDLVITSAQDEKRNPIPVFVRSRSVRIFRADPTVDEFTRQGGVYWHYGNMTGKVKLTIPTRSEPVNDSEFGPIVMVVRDKQSVRVYTMTPDFRC